MNKYLQNPMKKMKNENREPKPKTPPRKDFDVALEAKTAALQTAEEAQSQTELKSALQIEEAQSSKRKLQA
ncbi:uncharacterized protein G2W53_033361 [Senna tora]|uniref:Uncharacterized protein n=1 Tax=Senna tora TaxID=362788 RepID=A0A834T0G1_9FABA|nr:uncharacterized protein G2W53_033361 [Senna tora]